jgi:hypothetical protein
MQQFSNVGKQFFGWARIVALVRWLGDRIGVLVAAKLRRCAGRAFGNATMTTRPDDPAH